jgi:hypothetical protein
LTNLVRGKIPAYLLSPAQLESLSPGWIDLTLTKKPEAVIPVRKATAVPTISSLPAIDASRVDDKDGMLGVTMQEGQHYVVRQDKSTWQYVLDKDGNAIPYYYLTNGGKIPAAILPDGGVRFPLGIVDKAAKVPGEIQLGLASRQPYISFATKQMIAAFEAITSPLNVESPFGYVRFGVQCLKKKDGGVFTVNDLIWGEDFKSFKIPQSKFDPNSGALFRAELGKEESEYEALKGENETRIKVLEANIAVLDRESKYAADLEALVIEIGDGLDLFDSAFDSLNGAIRKYMETYVRFGATGMQFKAQRMELETAIKKSRIENIDSQLYIMKANEFVDSLKLSGRKALPRNRNAIAIEVARNRDKIGKLMEQISFWDDQIQNGSWYSRLVDKTA